MNSIWMNLGIEDFSFLELAKIIIPKCEFEVFSIKEECVYAAIMKPNEFGNNEILVPRFHYVTKKEQDDILSDVWDENKKYELDIMPYGFYFPDCPLRFLKRVIPGGFDEIIENKIKNYFYESNCLVFNKRLLYMSVFIILHEYGHYISYKSFNSNKVAYAKHVYEAKKSFITYENMLKDKGVVSKEEMLERLVLYRSGEEEAFADQYAIEHIEESVQSVISILKQKNNIQ